MLQASDAGQHGPWGRLSSIPTVTPHGPSLNGDPGEEAAAAGGQQADLPCRQQHSCVAGGGVQADLRQPGAPVKSLVRHWQEVKQVRLGLGGWVLGFIAAGTQVPQRTARVFAIARRLCRYWWPARKNLRMLTHWP